MHHIGLSLAENADGIPDLHLDEFGNLATVADAEAVGQHVMQRLKTFEGEWFLDTDAGVPWLGQLLGEAFDPVLAETVMKAEVVETHGVDSINSFSVRFDRTKRRLDAHQITLTTDYDKEEITL